VWAASGAFESEAHEPGGLSAALTAGKWAARAAEQGLNWTGEVLCRWSTAGRLALPGFPGPVRVDAAGREGAGPATRQPGRCEPGDAAGLRRPGRASDAARSDAASRIAARIDAGRAEWARWRRRHAPPGEPPAALKID
jgi:hypothetical protein